MAQTQLSPCTFKPTEIVNADGWRRHRCTRCNYVTAFIPPWSQRISRACPYVGVGDYIAHGLAAFGITKERVTWVRSFFASPLEEEEVAKLFPGETDKTLIGNRLKELFAEIGIPPCGGCNARAEWMNSAHQWLRAKVSGHGT